MKYFSIIILIFLSACSNIKTHSYYIKGKDLFQNKQYITAYYFAKKAAQEAPDNLKYSSLLTWTYIMQGKTKKAAKTILPFEKKSSDNIQIIQAKSWIEYSNGKNELAIELFKKGLHWADQKNNKDQTVQSIKSDALYGLGLIENRKLNFEQSRKYFKKALKYKNNFIGHKPIKIAYADTFYQEQKYIDAQKEYEKIASDLDSYIYAKIAWCLYFSKKYTDAEIYLLKELYNAKDKRPLLYALVFSTFAQKKYSQANKYLISLIDTDPSFADTKEIWQLIYISQYLKDIPLNFIKQYYLRGNFERASTLIKDSINNKSKTCYLKNVDIWCELYQSQALIALSQFNEMIVNKACDKNIGILGQGISLLYMGFYSDARNSLNQINQNSKYYLRSQMGLAAIDFLNGNFEKSIALYSNKKDALFKNKENYWAYLNLNTLGWSYIYSEDFQKAEQIFSNLNDIKNQITGIHILGMAWAKFKQGKVDDAVSDLINNNLSSDEHFKKSILLANAFYLQEDYKSAIDIYEENIIPYIPDKELFFSWGSYTLNNLGWSYIYSKEYLKALKIFLRLKDYHAAPIYFSIHENLGWGFYYLKMFDKSKEAFNYAIKINPNSVLAQKGLKMIIKSQNRSHK